MAMPGEFSRRKSAVELVQSWRVLCAAALGIMICCLPSSAMGVFLNPWSNAFGWSLPAISLLTVCLGLGTVLTGPLTGRLMDRFGGRRVVLLYIPALMLSVTATSFIGDGIWALYATMFLRGCIGTGLAAYARVVSVQFERQRGTALGLMFMGIGVSDAVGPRLAQWIVDAHGWRMAQGALGGIALLAWPIAFAWLSEKPAATATRQAEPIYHGCSRRESLRMAVFWLLAGSYFFWMLATGGILFLIPFLSAGGMSQAQSTSQVAIIGLATVIGLPIFGTVIDRLHAPFIAAAAIAAAACAFAMLAVLGNKYAFLAMPLLGFAASAWMTCLDYSTARYFGLRSFGEISGFIDRIAALGGMIGPIIFSLALGTSNNYSIPYAVVTFLAGISALLMAIAGVRPFCFHRPRRADEIKAGGRSGAVG